MHLRTLLFCALLPTTAWAQSSFTDARDRRPTDSFAISACVDAANREVRNRNPMAGNVESLDSHASPSSDTRTDVDGKGRFKDPTGATRNFSFRCGYDLRSNATSSVSVNFTD